MQVFLADIANQKITELLEQEGSYIPDTAPGTPRLITNQGDVGIKFRAILTDNAQEYFVPEKGTLSVWYMGSSGTGNYTSAEDAPAVSVSGSTVEICVHRQMTACAGAGILWVILYLPDGKQKTLIKMPYITAAGPDMDSPEAEQYYQAFSDMIAQMSEFMENFTTDKTLTIENMAADAASVGAAIQNMAPAGYGIGENIISGTYLRNLNDLTAKTGIYAYSVTAQNRPDESFGGGFVLHVNYDETIACQILLNNSPNCICYRKCYLREWEPWQWLNPPMTPGVEYCTARRWNGNLVYTKLVDCGAASNGKEVSHGITGGNFIQFCGMLANLALPIHVNTNYNASVRLTTTAVVISENGYDNKAVKVQIWYTKT